MRVAPKSLAARVGRSVLPTSGPSRPQPVSLLDTFVRAAPSAQAAVDLFVGEWSSSLPDQLEVVAGDLPLFADSRIDWLLSAAGDVKGWNVLELGPLEGGHTFQLANAGARVTAVEANTRAYLKCLVAKELLGLADSRFLLGDFASYLETLSGDRYDLVVASGVLHHAGNPLRLLELLSLTSDRLALSAHYFDAGIIAAVPRLSQHFTAPPVTRRFYGRDIPLHRRDYSDDDGTDGFCRGPESHAFWMEHDDLLAVLSLLGYDDVRIGGDDRTHPHGPNVLIYATRGAATGV